MRRAGGASAAESARPAASSTVAPHIDTSVSRSAVSSSVAASTASHRSSAGQRQTAADLNARLPWLRAFLIASLIVGLMLAALAGAGRGFASLWGSSVAGHAAKAAAGAAAAGAASGSWSIHSSPAAASQSPAAAASSSPAASSQSGSADSSLPVSPTATASTSASATAAPPVSVYDRSAQVPTTWRIVRRYKHDTRAFTQGLQWVEAPAAAGSVARNVLFESRGMWAASGVRKMTLTAAPGEEQMPSAAGATGAKGDFSILADVPIDSSGEYFGEGLCYWPTSANASGAAGAESGSGNAASTSSWLESAGGVLVQLTWTNRKAFLYSPVDLGRRGSFNYATTISRERNNEGWGLTHDGGSHLVVSDGTANLLFWRFPYSLEQGLSEPAYELARQVTVRDASTRSGITGAGGTPVPPGTEVPRLNELEYVHGWVLANIWFDNRVAIIDPATGYAVTYLDLTPLRAEQRNPEADVLNGIAYTVTLGPRSATLDGAATQLWGGRLWVTGKQWETLYEIELGGLQTPAQLELPPARMLKSQKGKGKTKSKSKQTR